MSEPDRHLPFKRPSVLVVDDVEDNCVLLRTFLRKGEFDVRTVMSGAEALQAVESSPYDVVLMDLQMPEMDGWEAARRIRLNGFKGRIVACSAIGFGTKAFLRSQPDFDGFLPKPISRGDLVSCLNGPRPVN